MLRDQGAETMDSKVLDDLTVADFNTDTVRAYRNRFRTVRQGSSWTDLDDERFLRAVGAAMVTEKTVSFILRSAVCLCSATTMTSCANVRIISLIIRRL